MRRAVVLANDGDGDPGVVGDALVGAGFELERWWREDFSSWPADLADAELVVSLGSDWSVYAEHVRQPVEAEAARLAAAHEAGVAVFGICFGGQMLARALGGSVQRLDSAEIGWFEVQSDEPNLVPGGRWAQWHSDGFTPPKSARIIARSALCPQAFTIGRSLGLQFHPEITPSIMGRWAEIERQRVPADVDLDDVMAQTRAAAESNRRRATELTNAFLGWAGLLP